jgi:hypothetical protein
MNSWKLNGIAGHIARIAICKSLKMEHASLYRSVKNIDNNGIITIYNGKKYELILKEVK